MCSLKYQRSTRRNRVVKIKGLENQSLLQKLNSLIRKLIYIQFCKKVVGLNRSYSVYWSRDFRPSVSRDNDTELMSLAEVLVT